MFCLWCSLWFHSLPLICREDLMSERLTCNLPSHSCSQETILPLVNFLRRKVCGGDERKSENKITTVVIFSVLSLSCSLIFLSIHRLSSRHFKLWDQRRSDFYSKSDLSHSAVKGRMCFFFFLLFSCLSLFLSTFSHINIVITSTFSAFHSLIFISAR